ncbi:MAG TPA: BREX system P-loop protein BrxC, partial [Anaerolineaceae bacterium]|nr:BREX system P-loop protein BrxC [Anaerolineaceae bacterium]
MTAIRDLFSDQRQIGRKIEKVIDYYADDETRLAAEIDEYEATQNVEACFRKFLDSYQAGVQSGQVTEVGIWVSGFYGSGKSSFTKYLGFALDPRRTVQGRPFLELLQNRLRSADVRAQLATVAKKHPTAVVMLDLGTEQLADSTANTVTNILYWKVLQRAGYSKEKKLAQLEFTLAQRGQYEAFRQAYQGQFGEPWEQIHDDPLLGIARASQLLPAILPQEFPDPAAFLRLRFEMTESVRDLAERMISVVRRISGAENILFLVDEAGQYVAPRGDLILNLDGLARSFKELGQGKVWVVATGQQTLAEIVERAAYNSPELVKLRDRFPLAVELDARDIREITYRRLLTKSNAGETRLRALFKESGQSLVWHTRLQGTTLYKDDPSSEDFVRFYPFLPQHFDVLMQLIRVLARGTGGVGLRSAIRVIQDVLVDTARILPSGETRLADRPVGALATAADFYKTLRVDIQKALPHVVSAVERVEQAFAGRALPVQAAQAVAALQLLEDFPRTAENIAALLYPQLGFPPLVDDVRAVLSEIAGTRGVGLIEDPQSGGYQFLSENVEPFRRERTKYIPNSGEVNRIRNEELTNALAVQPKARLEGAKDIPAGVRLANTWLFGDREEINFQLELVTPEAWETRRAALLTETAQANELRNTILWMLRREPQTEDALPEVRRSEYVVELIGDQNADRDLAQYARSEAQRATNGRGQIKTQLENALLDGLFIFRGKPTPVRQAGASLEAAAQAILKEAAAKIFHQFHLVKLSPPTNQAAHFLEVDRLDRMTVERDPLKLVTRQGSTARVAPNHPALAEALRAFKEKADGAGGGRLTGKAIQDHFSAAPYGWSKDAARYLFAALLVAGEIEFVLDGQPIRTASPAAVEAVKTTMAFNHVGVGLRGSRPGIEVLDRAAHRLEALF